MKEEIRKLLAELHDLDPALAQAAWDDISRGEAEYSEQTEDLLKGLMKSRQR